MESVDEVPRRRGESGGEINGGALVGEEKQGRGLAARHGKGSKCQRGEGVGPEGRGAGQVVSQGSEGHAAGGETTVAVALCRSGEAGGRG